MEWTAVKGSEEMTPLELNAVPLSSGRHSAVTSENASDAVPGKSGRQSGAVHKTSLSALSSLK